MASQSYYNGAGQQPYNASAPPPNYGQQFQGGDPNYNPNYGNQQQYQQPYPPPQEQQPYNNGGYTNGAPPPPMDGKQDFTQAFAIQKPKYNDLWAGIAFILVFLGFVAVSVYSLTGFGRAQTGVRGSFGNNRIFGLNRNVIGLFGFTLAVSVVFSALYFALARIATKQLIWISGILNIVAAFATAGYLFYAKAWAGAIIALLIAVFTVICFISWIPRIPFSVLMFQTVVDVSRQFGHVYLVSAIGGIGAALYAAWVSATLVAVYARFQPANPNGVTGPNASRGLGAVAGLFVFVTFAAYWTSEWWKNTIHTIISGVYGSWYVSSLPDFLGLFRSLPQIFPIPALTHPPN